ncbi:MAG: hypothetical protein Q9217_006242 [Psora testacea]
MGNLAFSLPRAFHPHSNKLHSWRRDTTLPVPPLHRAAWLQIVQAPSVESLFHVRLGVGGDEASNISLDRMSTSRQALQPDVGSERHLNMALDGENQPTNLPRPNITPLIGSMESDKKKYEPILPKPTNQPDAEFNSYQSERIPPKQDELANRPKGISRGYHRPFRIMVVTLPSSTETLLNRVIISYLASGTRPRLQQRLLHCLIIFKGRLIDPMLLSLNKGNQRRPSPRKLLPSEI